MNCYQDGIRFVEDSDTFPLYGYAVPEDLMALDAMAGYGKQHQPEIWSFDFNNGAQYQLPASYDSPVTNQNDLAALPQGYGSEYEERLVYAPSHEEAYTHHSLGSTTSASYANVPITAPAPVRNYSQVYTPVPTSKKRKASVESCDSEIPAAKRVAVALQDPSGEYYEPKDEPSPYSSFVPTPTTGSGYVHAQLAVSPRILGHHYSTSNTSQVSLPAHPPYTPTVSPSFTTANTEHSPRAPATPGPRPASVGSNPKLVRTSTIPHPSPQAIPSSMTLVGHSQSFNPYAMYSPDSKARLHLKGDLDAVAKDWSEDELKARRKIVTFERDQKGNEIYASFKVVSQNDWKNHHGSVSCIWWAEKKEAYVTSVDTILLLEAIVAARFTVEEKNRIRRNLEGFKPDTVSKAKPETEEFFKVIMGFPNPKPRNIEKDVKVFPWRILSVALQKIISKYTASYASTVGPKMCRALEHHEYSYSASPGPEYHGTVQVANFPVYEPHGRVSAPATPAPQMYLNPHGHHAHEPHPGYSYQQVHMPQHSHAQYHSQPMTAPIQAPAQFWHYPAYTADSQMPMAPASAPPTAYPREMIPQTNYRGMQVAIPQYHH